MAESNVAPSIAVATQHHQAGRLPEAEALYEEILHAQPDHYDATRLLGIVAAQTGRFDRAAALLARAIQLRPQQPVAYNDLAEAFRVGGRMDDAITVRRQLVQIQPTADNHAALGILYRQHKRLNDAAEWFQRSLAMKPNDADLCNLLGVTLADQIQYERAIPLYRKAIALDPSMDRAWNNLAGALLRMGEPFEAETVCRAAIAQNPANVIALGHFGAALIQQRRYDEAIGGLREALEKYPDSPDLHCAVSWVERLTGDLQQGFADFEYRWKLPDMQAVAAGFDKPFWDGSDLAGKTLLMHYEGGFGDTIQCARYCSVAKERGARVALVVRPALARLLGTVPGVDEVAGSQDDVPDFDFVCSLQSAAYNFKTTLETIPSKVPYVSAPSEATELWRKRLAADGFTGKRIGLAWAGNLEFALDRQRSIPVEALAQLKNASNAKFYSLQFGPQARQRIPGLDLIDYTGELKDFADSAALMQNLDIIISPDSAMAHLAGAMAKKTFVLLPFAPDWRWLLDRTDSPWYPTARLIRQKSAGKWDAVISELVDLLNSPGNAH